MRGDSVPFGSADREMLRHISGQLGQITADLAAVKQQVADQQHTIDQIRQDTTAAINTGLAEIRAVARDAMARTNETTTGPLANIGNELVALRGSVAQIEGQLRTAARPTEPAMPEPEPAPAEDVQPEPAATEPQQPEDQPDLDTLRAAAGISAATLYAHRDTWEFLVKHAGQDQHFHLPAAATPNGGGVVVAVSGPTLVATLTSLADVKRDPSVPHGTAAIAHHLHKRITDTVKEIISNPHSGDPAKPVSIIIDDRAKPADDED